MIKTLKWAKHYDCLLEQPLEGHISEYILDGGRSGGKTQHLAIVAIYETAREEGGNFICARANAVDLATSVRAMVVKKIEEAGLAEEYDVPMGRLTITHRRTGHHIYFRAYEKSITRTKGDEPSGRVAGVWIDEANEGRNPLMLDSMLTTYYRHMTGGGKIYYSYNPMPQPGHWSHEYFAKKKLAADTRYLWCNWTHIFRFLPKPLVRKILDAKKTNEKYYRFWYQGELVSFDGLIFPQWNRDKHYIGCDYLEKAIASGNYPRLLLVGVDGGTKRDMTACAPCLLLRNNQFVLLDKYYHNPVKTVPLAPGRQAGYIDRFIKDLKRKFPVLNTLPIAFVFDSDSGSQEIMLQLIQSHGYAAQAVPMKRVWADIHRFQDLLDEDLFYCVNGNGYKDYYLNQWFYSDPFVDEIENYVYDPVTNDIKKDQTEHILKATIYAVKSIYSEPKMRSLNTEFLTRIGLIQNNYSY